MTNRILLHMPEHSQDISIHSKPFETIHDIEARLNPINKIQSDCPYIVLLIIFKYAHHYYKVLKTNRYVKPDQDDIFHQINLFIRNIILQKRSVAFYMNVSVFVLIQQTIATIDFLLVEFDTNSFLHFFLDIFKYRPNIKQ